VAREVNTTSGLTTAGSPQTGFRIEPSIARLTRRTSNDHVEIVCEVNLIVGRLPSKVIVMTTTGTATARALASEVGPEQDRTMQKDALEGAVRGAYANVLTFLKRRR
jgi:hypothetical protein